MDALARIKISLGPSGTPSDSQVMVNDQDVTDLIGAFSLTAQAGAYPTLKLVGLAHGQVEGVGIVQVVSDRDEREAIAAFLAAVDPKELERVALARGGQNVGVTQAILDTLREWASGG